MEAENNNNDAMSDTDINESVSFSQVSAVVTGWTLDFMFLSLLRRFKEGKLDAFNETLSTLEAISQSPALKGKVYSQKTLIAAFLARVMHGKQIDVQFDEDTSVMPLMSAAQLWSELENTVADESLFKNVTILLLVQAVAVCLEKGKRSSAFSVLEWFENNQQFPQRNLKVKLTTIVTKGDTYHPFLMSFSFSRLLETVATYLDVYLEKNPSDYLLKAAKEMVRSSKNTEVLEKSQTQDSSASEPANKSTKSSKEKVKTRGLRTKRKLLSTTLNDLWKPESCKKPLICLKRITQSELSQVNTLKKTANTSENKCEQKKRKMPQKWTAELDKYLKEGVRRHGPGKWSRILLDYDFEGRTGTMLKDRWRILIKDR